MTSLSMRLWVPFLIEHHNIKLHANNFVAKLHPPSSRNPISTESFITVLSSPLGSLVLFMNLRCSIISRDLLGPINAIGRWTTTVKTSIPSLEVWLEWPELAVARPTIGYVLACTGSLALYCLAYAESLIIMLRTFELLAIV